jgi:hypothetical protein
MFLEVFAYGSLGLVLDGTAFHPAVAIPVTAVAVFALSLAVTALLQRVPGLRWIVP